ncbi:MAG: endonuclease/exonuclease/phosphatase family protein [Gammaproteobacteria bacterium]|nr:endonuclease/exonuclease/phosphatase family protein [Gammaproteobacteria bacterium]
MKFVSYNIQYGTGKDGRVDLPRIADEVAGADVIALQEVERFWRRTADTDQVLRLAESLQEYHWVYGAGVDVSDDRVGDDGVVERRRRQFGNMLLSRYPIVSTRNHLLPKYASLGPLSIQRSALEGVIDIAGHMLRCYAVHLTHLTAMTRLVQVAKLLEIHDSAVREGGPITGALEAAGLGDQGIEPAMPAEAIIMGDFNFEPDSEEYTQLVGPMSSYGGRVTNPAGFVDAWTALGHQLDTGTTSDIDSRPARVDYCFVSTSLKDCLRSISVDTAAQGSDHQPLWIEFDF